MILCLNVLCVPGNLPAICWPMRTRGDITCLTGTASHMVANFWDGIQWAKLSYQYGWVKHRVVTASVAPTKDKEAILLHISKGGRLYRFRFGSIKRFIPAHRPAPNLLHHEFVHYLF